MGEGGLRMEEGGKVPQTICILDDKPLLSSIGAVIKEILFCIET